MVTVSVSVFPLQGKTPLQEIARAHPVGSEPREQPHAPQLSWIAADRRFTSAEIVFFAGRGALPLREALLRFDVLVTGPHATAAIPEELRTFLSSTLTRRKRFDFSDVSTSAIGRRWAEIDDHVLYIENPHPRLVLDPNRPPPADLEANLREAFRRVRAAGPGQPVDLDGVDAVRPVTFAFEPVLVEPRDATGWRTLIRSLRDCAARGTHVYMATRDRLLRALLQIHCGSAPAHSMLHVMSLHDTMAARIRPDGAITDERPPLERLPALVSLGNRGDARGEPVPEPKGRNAPGEEVTIAPAELRRVAASFRISSSTPTVLAGRYVAMNRVYRGGWETIAAGAQMRGSGCVLPARNSERCRLGAYMAEFAREALLDRPALTALRAPGTGWPTQDPAHINSIAKLLKATYDGLRQDVIH